MSPATDYMLTHDASAKGGYRFLNALMRREVTKLMLHEELTMVESHMAELRHVAAAQRAASSRSMLVEPTLNDKWEPPTLGDKWEPLTSPRSPGAEPRAPEPHGNASSDSGAPPSAAEDGVADADVEVSVLAPFLSLFRRGKPKRGRSAAASGET